MQSRYARWLIPIILLFAVAGWLAWPTNSRISIPIGNSTIERDISVRQGLDLKGGLQVLLEADVPEGQSVDGQAMAATIGIVDSRVNALGVAEPVVQQSGDRRLVVELPGLTDPEQALALLKQTGLLEFVDTGTQSIPAGTLIQTDYNASAAGNTASTATAAPTVEGGTATESAATAEATTTGEATATSAASPTATGPVYHTLMTGSALTSANVQNQNGIVVAFELTEEGKTIFAQHTANNIGRFLTITLDKRVISSPSINSAIPDGKGIIQGSFSLEEANQLAQVLRYGSLPVPLRIAESRTVGATLGEDSVRQSVIAGAVGLSIVALFMILYYRLPGVIAVLALLLYATITFALFKLIPVTLTLAGIAGFVLSVGVAVDANILIFERMKEELRSGKKLVLAVDEGFRRAWSSIFDSNVSTLITCFILFWFGSQFGASVVKGFALTLALGVFVSLFTAIVVTRTVLHAVLDNIDFSERHSWFGI